METITNVPLVLKGWMVEDIPVSQLKNVDTSLVDDVLYIPDRPAKLKRLLSVIADDLINIYEGDYATEVTLIVSRETLKISFKKGYPFYYKTSGFEGLVENVTHEFNLKECVDDNAINNMINDNINRQFENNQYLLDRHSIIAEKQSLYANLKIVDNLLFENNRLFKTFSYLDSVHEQDQYETQRLGHVEANVFTSDSGYYIFFNYGKLFFSISKSDIKIKRKLSAKQYGIVSVHNSKRMNIQELECSFVEWYNKEHDTDYTTARDIVLIHDMLEI
jgi:hypothetical protein